MTPVLTFFGFLGEAHHFLAPIRIFYNFLVFSGSFAPFEDFFLDFVFFGLVQSLSSKLHNLFHYGTEHLLGDAIALMKKF